MFGIDKIGSGIFFENIKNPKKEFLGVKEGMKQKDTAEISNTSKAFRKLDEFMNLGNGGNRVSMEGLNEMEKAEFLKMLAVLLKEGIVGYEVLEIDGKPERHDILDQIVDKRTRGAKLYRKDIIE